MEKAGKMPYYRVPPDALEDGEVFLTWAQPAVAASQRAAKAKPQKTKTKAKKKAGK